MKIVQDEILI